jgi:O-antigen/teichoic acid export membrane protein
MVGWWIGDEVVGLLYGVQYSPTSIVAGLSAAGVMAAAAAQVVSQVLVAEGRTTRLAWAWFGGLMLAVVLLFVVPGEADTRVAFAFAAGEATALILMGVLAVRGRSG